MRSSWRALLPLVLAAAGPSGLTVMDGWSRATLGPGATAVGYLVIRNPTGRPDRLTGAGCAGAATTTLHQTTHGVAMGGDMAGMAMDHMAALAAVPIPAGATVAFAPGGMHLMLSGMARGLRPGDGVDCMLHFANAGDVAARLSVQGAGDAQYRPQP